MDMEEEVRQINFLGLILNSQKIHSKEGIPDNTITKVHQRKKEKNEKFYFRD